MDQKLLERFLAGHCSEEECERIIFWYLSGKADKELSEQIKAHWIKTDDEATKEIWDKEGVFDKLSGQIQNPMHTIHPKQKPKSKYNHRKYLPYAASAVLLLTMAILWQQFTKEPPVTPGNFYSQFIHQETAKGQKKQLVLPDGTTITMNSDSRIWYHPDFVSAPERVVYLEGEAFFEVTKDRRRPFVIHSGEVVTRVLGTSFNVQAFANENIRISLVKGEVEVEEPRQMLRLKAGEEAVYSRIDRSLAKQQFEPFPVLAWKNGILYFKNERFSEIVEELERWYGVDIEVKKENIEDGFTGSYDNKSLGTVMEGMGFVLGFTYEIRGNKVVIK